MSTISGEEKSRDIYEDAQYAVSWGRSSMELYFDGKKLDNEYCDNEELYDLGEAVGEVLDNIPNAVHGSISATEIRKELGEDREAEQPIRDGLRQ